MASTAANSTTTVARPPPPPDSNAAKKTKAKKAADPVDTGKQVMDRLANLERTKAEEKEKEEDIEREVNRANNQLKRLLDSIHNDKGKLETIQKRYSELLAEMERTKRKLLKSERQAEQYKKERDESRKEANKLKGFQDKIRDTASVMQKDNKRLKDENRRLTETESRMREELHERLEGMVTDVQDFIDQKESPESLPANMETDELFRHKFKSFIEQYELRELQFHALLRTKELEVAYQGARYEQQRRAQEQEASKSRELTSQVSTFSQTETELRSQLNIYVEKFKQVEDTLNNSNDLFLTFRREMEEMSKKTKRLEKENHNLTRKHDLTSHNILQMAEERTKATKEMEMLRRKNENLEKLCRGMQAQGRVIPGAAAGAQGQQQQQQTAGAGPGGLNGQAHGNGELLDDVGTESEYEYEDDDEEEDDDLDEFEEDETEDDAALLQATAGVGAGVGLAQRTSPGAMPHGQSPLPAYAPPPLPTPPLQHNGSQTKQASGGTQQPPQPAAQVNGVRH